ncbi:MAG: hypothetical protein AB7F67_15525 [Rhodospirillaceae bacterium]
MLSSLARALAGPALRRGQAAVSETLRHVWLLLAAIVLFAIAIVYGLSAAFTVAALEYGVIYAAAGFAVVFAVAGGIVLAVASHHSKAEPPAPEPEPIDALLEPAELDRLLVDVGRSLGREASPLAILAVAALTGFALGRR